MFWQRRCFLSHSASERETGIWDMRNNKTGIAMCFNKGRDVLKLKYKITFNYLHRIKAILTGTHATSATHINQGMIKSIFHINHLAIGMMVNLTIKLLSG